MKFVSEEVIDKITEELDGSTTIYEEAVAELREEQPAILAYLFNEELKVLTLKEKEYLLYLILVIWKSIEAVVEESIAKVSPDVFTQREEENWSIIDGQKKKHFRDKLDVFFDGYPQEDLLAFVEDALVEEEEEEEEDIVTNEGREALFVILKTILDCWTQYKGSKKSPENS